VGRKAGRKRIGRGKSARGEGKRKGEEEEKIWILDLPSPENLAPPLMLTSPKDMPDYKDIPQNIVLNEFVIQFATSEKHRRLLFL
jgi:hypothetical protein